MKVGDFLSIVLVDGDDWEGLYVNGQLVAEGHSLDFRSMVIEALGVKCIDADYEWLAYVGRLPTSIDDVVLS